MSESGSLVTGPVGLNSSQSLIASMPSDISTTSITLPSLNTFQRPTKNDVQQIPSQPSPLENVNCFSSPMPMSPHQSPVSSIASPMPPPAPSPLQHQFQQADPRLGTNGNIPQSSPGSHSTMSAPSTPIPRPPQSPSMHMPNPDTATSMPHSGVPSSPHHHTQAPLPPMTLYQPQNHMTSTINDVGTRIVTQTKLAPAPRRRNNQQQRSISQMQAREFRQPERPMVANGPPIRQSLSSQSLSSDGPFRGNMTVYPGPSNPQPIGTMMPPPQPSPNVMQQSTNMQPMNSLRGPPPPQQGLPVQLSRMSASTRNVHPRVLLQQAPVQHQVPPQSPQQSHQLPQNQGQSQQNIVITQQNANFSSPAKPQMSRGQPISQQMTMSNVQMRPVVQNVVAQPIPCTIAPQMVAGVSQPVTTPTPRTQATAALFNTDDSTRLPPKEQYRTLKRKFKFLVYENECYQDQLRNLQTKLLKLSRDKNFLLDRLLQYERPSSSSDEDSDSSVNTQVDERPKPKKKARPNRRRPIPSTSGTMIASLPGPSGAQMLASIGNGGPTLGSVLTAKRQPSQVVGQLLAQAIAPTMQQPSTSRIEFCDSSNASQSISSQSQPMHAQARAMVSQNMIPNSSEILLERAMVSDEPVAEANLVPKEEPLEGNQPKEVLTQTTTTPEISMTEQKTNEAVEELKTLVNGQNNTSPVFSIKEIENNLKEVEKLSTIDVKKEEE
ncbi:unnamed protein product, partial [Mesorhabditis belari]|uniref:INO80 complex subunit E n=1 Tax=Mesorhabditis belari TaxID=2138241 RepID=A0AAF3EB12_9BILA